MRLKTVLILMMVYFGTVAAAQAQQNAPTAVAQNTPSTALPNQSLEYWQQKVLVEPGVALHHFNYGVLLHKNKDYNGAIAQYDEVIALESPLKAAAVYYKAQALEAQGKTDEAKDILSSLSLKDVPPKFKERILTYKNRLFAESFALPKNEDDETPRTEKNEKRLSLFLDYSRGSNSNPEATNENTTVTVTADQQSQIRAGLDVLALYSPDYDVKLGYAYLQTNYEKQTTLNYSYHDVTLPVAYYLDNARVKLTPEFFRDYYGSDVFSEQTGLSFDYTYKFGDNYFGINLLSTNIKNKTATYSYLTGSQTKIQLSYTQNFTSSKATYRVYTAHYRYQDTASLASSYQTGGLNLGYTLYAGSFDFSLSTNFEARTYARAPTTTTQRSDFKSSADLEIGVMAGQYLRFYGEAAYTDNRSNYNTTTDDRTYKQSLFLLGLQLSY